MRIPLARNLLRSDFANPIEDTVNAPEGSEVLAVQIEQDELRIWLLGDPNTRECQYHFLIATPVQQEDPIQINIPEEYDHCIGTVLDNTKTLTWSISLPDSFRQTNRSHSETTTTTMVTHTMVVNPRNIDIRITPIRITPLNHINDPHKKDCQIR